VLTPVSLLDLWEMQICRNAPFRSKWHLAVMHPATRLLCSYIFALPKRAGFCTRCLRCPFFLLPSSQDTCANSWSRGADVAMSSLLIRSGRQPGGCCRFDKMSQQDTVRQKQVRETQTPLRFIEAVMFALSRRVSSE